MNTGMHEIIRTENLSKQYKGVRAVDGLSISVRRGEIYGFLGLNGAGKTTTIRMLLGMIRPSSGAAFIGEKRVDAGNYRLWSDIGYLVEMPFSYPDLTVRENLEIVRSLRNIRDAHCIDKVMEILKISLYANRKAKHLSLGNAQRLGLAKALMHEPTVLLLDEPANGLDPAGIVEIRELLGDLAENHGVTVFISSHILGEIARIATRIAIIHEGKLLQELNTAQLDDQRERRLLLSARDPEALRWFLVDRQHKFTVSEEGYMVLTDAESVAHPETMASNLVAAGIPLTLLKVEEEDLETYFLRVVRQGRGR
jgi:ABC-2 type transport system ATP-binding protein